MPEKKFYLTKKGLERIKKEYKYFRGLNFSKINREALPEYLSFQENSSFLKTKIDELENVLKNFELIKKPSKKKQNIVRIGATVVLEQKGRKICEFMIVGVLEANPNEGKISFESPLGRALLGHKINDEIAITFPIKTSYKIKKIKYC